MTKKTDSDVPEGFYVPETDLYRHLTHFEWKEVGSDKRCWVLEKPGVRIVRLKKPAALRSE